MAETTRNIVIVGGSYGGASIAHYLLKHALPKLPDNIAYQIVLISASAQVICRPATPRALISDDLFDQSKLFVNLEQMFAQYPSKSFRFVKGLATKLDHSARTVEVSPADGEPVVLEFYALVLATGASTTSPLLSLNKDEHSLRESWKAFRAALPEAKSIVIAGGGPAGVEVAGELGEHLNGRPGWFGSKTPKVAITLVTSGPELLPILRPAIARKAEKLLTDVGVTVIKGTKVVSVLPEGAGSVDVATKTTVTLSDGKTLDADLYIPAVGYTPNTSFVDPSLLISDGRVETNPSTLRVDKAGPRIYAIGDACSAFRPAIHLLTEAVPVLGANIKRDLLLGAGKSESEVGADKVYKEDTSETQLVPIGKSKGVGAAKGYQMPGLMVWAIKGRDYWLWTTGPLWSGKQWAKEA